MPKPVKLSIIFLLIFNVFSLGVLSLQAADLQGPTQSGATLDTLAPEQPAGLLPAPNGPPCPANSLNCGNYTLNDMVGVALKISELILSLVGSLALIAFIAGGLMWLLSAGNAEWVTRGKQAIIGAVVGLAIVFTSFMIIQLVYSALGIEKATKNSAWSVFTGTKSDWFQ